MPGSENSTDVIILAAGKGKRMHQAFPGVPKALVPLAGKPMLIRVLDAVERSGAARRVFVVVGPAVEAKVRAALKGREITFVLQGEPKGTGHAVLCARPQVSDDAEHLLVLYGDHPLYSAGTIRRLVRQHIKSSAPVTMLTVPLADFKDWRASFADWGRVIRSADGKFKQVVEAKDATGKQLAVTEVNPALYCFRADWLWRHLPQVKCENVHREYYLPDVLGFAVKEGEMVETVPVPDAREAMGANTPEQLSMLEEIYARVKEIWGKG
ncbi:hypothetical protein EPN90_04365 [Patescibacteria group bacterium]|nr:MAG: hypothetical protein EPN90_04365 [Patescibacteria group bacterium]